jgi:hypothetical protein
VPRTEKDRRPVQADPGDGETSDPDTPEASEWKERRGSLSRPRPGKGLDKGPDREYFSPSGVKLEIIELPVKYVMREWLKHAEQWPDGSKAPWRCTWQTMKSGSPVPCDYSSKSTWSSGTLRQHTFASSACQLIWLALCLLMPFAGGFNVRGARKPSLSDPM